MWTGHHADGTIIREWESGQEGVGIKTTYPYNDPRAEESLTSFVVEEFGVHVEAYPKRGEIYVNGIQHLVCFDGVLPDSSTTSIVWFRRNFSGSSSGGMFQIAVVGLSYSLEGYSLKDRHELLIYIFSTGVYYLSPGR